MGIPITGTFEAAGDFPLMNAKDVSMEVKPGETNLRPNIYYQFGEVSELTVELWVGFPNAASEYVFEFTPAEGFTAPDISPEPTWLGSPQFPVGKKCIVSVFNGLAVSACG